MLNGDIFLPFADRIWAVGKRSALSFCSVASELKIGSNLVT